jgi:hypothetical protein
MKPIYRIEIKKRPGSAFGISVGDLVSSTYPSESGPFEVFHIREPRYVDDFGSAVVVRSCPVINLVCVSPARRVNSIMIEDASAIITAVRREGDRFFTDRNHEISVVKSAPTTSLQPSLFDPVELVVPPPPVLPAGVDYSRKAWLCDKCKNVWNAKLRRYGAPPLCPICPDDDWVPPVGRPFIVMPPRPRPPRLADSALILAHNAWK